MTRPATITHQLADVTGGAPKPDYRGMQNAVLVTPPTLRDYVPGMNQWIALEREKARLRGDKRY